MHLAKNAGLGNGLLLFVSAKRAAMQMLAPQQNRIQFQHVVTGFAILTAALAAGIGGDHPADGGAVRGG